MEREFKTESDGYAPVASTMILANAAGWSPVCLAPRARWDRDLQNEGKVGPGIEPKIMKAYDSDNETGTVGKRIQN